MMEKKVKKVKKVKKTKIQKDYTTKKFKFTQSQVIEALQLCGGFVSDVARKLNTSPKVINDYINKFEEIKQAKKDIEESYLDLSETIILKEIKAGNLKAAIYYCDRKGKERGYTQQVDTKILSDSHITLVVK